DMSDMGDLTAIGHECKYIFSAYFSLDEGGAAHAVNMRPFQISVPDETLDDLRQRLAMTLVSEPLLPREAGLGFDHSQLHRLLTYWRTEFDWRRAEEALNRFDHVLVKVDGLSVHALVARGEGADPMPLLVMHGWPSSFVEIVPALDYLTRPSEH